MLIDWFTVVAQIVNFLILVLLLRRFLYSPIVAAMAAREAKIAGQLAAATELQQKAQAEIVAYSRQRRDLEESSSAMLAAARAEAAALQQELVDTARQEVTSSAASWRDALRREQAQFLQELRRRAGQQLCTIAQRALVDLADAELEAQIVAVFLRRLRELESDLRAQMVAALHRRTSRVVVASAFPLTAAVQDQVCQVVRAELGGESGPELTVDFVVEPDLLAGVELEIDSFRIGWSVQDYLAALAAELEMTLAAELDGGQKLESLDVAWE